MRPVRHLRTILRIRKRRGYYRIPARPRRLLETSMQRYIPVGGVMVGPPGARRWALGLVRHEVESDSYVTDWRLAAALDRLLASMF